MWYPQDTAQKSRSGRPLRRRAPQIKFVDRRGFRGDLGGDRLHGDIRAKLIGWGVCGVKLGAPWSSEAPGRTGSGRCEALQLAGCVRAEKGQVTRVDGDPLGFQLVQGLSLIRRAAVSAAVAVGLVRKSY